MNKFQLYVFFPISLFLKKKKKKKKFILNRTNNSYPFFTHTHHCQHLAAPASYSLHTHFLPQPFESNLQASYPFNPKHISAFLKNRHILLHNYSIPIKFRKFKYCHNLIQSIFEFQSSFKFHVICFHSVQFSLSVVSNSL